MPCSASRWTVKVKQREEPNGMGGVRGLGAAAALMAAGTAAQAQEAVLGLGANGRLTDGEPTAALGLDVVFGDLLDYGRFSGGLGAALAVNSDADVWGGAGPVLRFDLGDGWRIEGSVMAGLYAENATDLGGPVAFHSRIGVSYAVTPVWRAGVSLGHISNAGIYDENPGIERVMVTLGYSL
jgi:hypothetical protein